MILFITGFVIGFFVAIGIFIYSLIKDIPKE